MREIFGKYKPEVIFHAAAHKHVPLMEINPVEAIKNNVFATKLIGELAGEFGTKSFVLISTDKAVNPTSVMGASKRIAEIVLQNLNNKYLDQIYGGAFRQCPRLGRFGCADFPRTDFKGRADHRHGQGYDALLYDDSRSLTARDAGGRARRWQ